MSYQYPETEQERAARVQLEKAGYTVQTPQCPDCHGWGVIGQWEAWNFPKPGGGSFSTTPCPRGCSQPTLIL